MQWSRACLVLVLDVRPSVEQELNHRPLFGRVPRLSRLGPRIARIMESGCSTPILGVRVSSSFDQRPDRERQKRGRREVERRISDIQLVRDFLHETLVGDARLRDLGPRSYEPHCLGFVGDDSSQELDKGRRSVRHVIKVMQRVVSQQSAAR
jgi:hypothetical protein